MSAKPHPNTVAFMKSPEFWDLFGLAMCNEKIAREWAEVSKIPVEQITAAAHEYLRREVNIRFAYHHPGTRSIN